MRFCGPDRMTGSLYVRGTPPESKRANKTGAKLQITNIGMTFDIMTFEIINVQVVSSIKPHVQYKHNLAQFRPYLLDEG